LKVTVIGYSGNDHIVIGELRVLGGKIVVAPNPHYRNQDRARKILESIATDPVRWAGQKIGPDKVQVFMNLLHTQYSGSYLRVTKPEIDSLKKWDEADHPRVGSGEHGGEFTSGGGGGAGAADDTKSWTKDKAPADQERAAKLETERQTAVGNVEKLVSGVTGSDESGQALTSPSQVKTWANMPQEWQGHAANGFISDYVNGNMPASEEWQSKPHTWDQVPQDWKDKGKADYLTGYAVGDSPTPAALAEGVANWEKMPDQEKLEYSQQMYNQNAAKERQRLTDEAGSLWGDMGDEGKLNFAQTEAKDFPELAVEEDDPDSDEPPSEMSVDDFGDWDGLPSDWQEKTKEKWMEDSYAEFEQSEKESFEPDRDYHEERVSEDEDAVHALIKEIPEENYIYPGMGEYETPEDAEEGGAEDKRREKEWQENFDLKASVDDGAFTWDKNGELTVDTDRLVFHKNPHEDDAQQMIPGVDRAELSNAYKKSQWEGVARDYEKEFKAKFEKAVEKSMEEESENYEPDKSSVEEYMEQQWDDGFSDKQKFKHAQNYLSDETVESDQESTAGSGGPIRIPKAFELFSGEDEKNPGDYKMTGRLGRALTIARAEQIAKERGIEDFGGVSSMESLGNTLWEGWKGSSTNSHGKLLQVASADELGGNLQPWLAEEADAIRKNRGYPAAKAYVRGLWETSQYLMHKAGMKELDIYRGIMVDGDKLAAEKTERVVVHGNDMERIAEKHFDQNGAASFTMKRDVANGWNGIGHNMPPNPKRVVLRARVPLTAVLALPAYGKNYHEEKEVVVVGTPWKKWDAWKHKAPTIGETESDVALKWRTARA